LIIAPTYAEGDEQQEVWGALEQAARATPAA
jgi:hypothetical protein